MEKRLDWKGTAVSGCLVGGAKKARAALVFTAAAGRRNYFRLRDIAAHQKTSDGDVNGVWSCSIREPTSTKLPDRTVKNSFDNRARNAAGPNS